MGVMERMSRLDDRAERFGQRHALKFDTQPPPWLKYSPLPFFLFAVASLPLTLATSPTFTTAVLGALVAVELVVVLPWVRKHHL